MHDAVIKEYSSLDSITELFNQHQNDPFTYLADIHLFRLFSRLKHFNAFVAEADGRLVGCIYALRYMCDCGWIGGLLVHERFRGKGIGGRLLERALRFLGRGYVHLFVEPENVAARAFFEKKGFSAVYRRLNYVVHAPIDESRVKRSNIDYGFEWDHLAAALGFEERRSIVNMGYYPIKVARHIFEDLKNERKILKCGCALAILENSHNIDVNGYTFTFNDYILEGLSVQQKEKIVEVNPFYTKTQVGDLIELINYLAIDEKVALWTYEKDPVARSLPLEGALGALVMEFYRY